LTGFLAALLISFAAAFTCAWLIYWLDRYEKEPLALLGGVFLWGAVLAAGMAFLFNTVFGVGVYLFTSSEALSNVVTGSLEAPVVEEALKGLAVLLVFLIFRREFDSVLDGIVYAAIAALGFAATENTYYIYHFGYLKNGWTGLAELAAVRIFLVGWQHPFYTAFIGIGLAAARLSRSTAVRLSAPLIGFAAAVGAHAMHNTLAEFLQGSAGLAVGAAYDWTGWLFMLLFIAWAIFRERGWIVKQLREEVSLGLITQGQYQTACSAWSQGWARFHSIFSGSYRATNRFYGLCAELAYKKEQLSTLGEEGGNGKEIERLREEMRGLNSRART